MQRFIKTSFWSLSLVAGAIATTGCLEQEYEPVTEGRHQVLGDGVIDPGEQCDDGNDSGGDGCSAAGQVESGFLCSGAPSLCCSGLASTFARVGNASINAETNEVIVVPEAAAQRGAVWFGQTFDLTTGFDYRFKISFGDNGGDAGADGFGFVFHRDPAARSALGQQGQGLGASGITPSLVVEFDTFDNFAAAGDIADDHTAVFTDTNATAADFIVLDPGPPAVTTVCLKAGCGDVEDGAYYDARIVWQPAPTPTLTVSLDGQQLFSLQRDIVGSDFGGDPQGIFFGFTASTGGSINEHKFCPQRLIADLDFDEDDASNAVDIDSDDDGIPDLNELSGFGGDPDADTDGDAVPDWNDPDQVACTPTDSVPAECTRGSLPATIDFDGDGAPNHLDLDSDSDGILDVEEAGHAAIDPATGRVSCPGGAGSNGLCDALETSPGVPSYTVADTDGDTAPDFLDLDTDGDGIADRVEGGARCPEGANAQVCAVVDSDLDGVSDGSDNTPGLGTDVSGAPLPDSDGDEVPDFRDLAVCGDGFLDGGEGCDDGDTAAGDGCSSDCAVETDYICSRADFSLVSEDELLGDTNDAPVWELSEDGFTVFQSVNSDPGVYVSSLPAMNIGDIEFTIAVETADDDDFVGVVLGFDGEEFAAADASYLLIDWKQETQVSGALGTANEGLAVSLVTGPTTLGDLWSHADGGTVRELARATSLGAAGWEDNVSYTWTLRYTETRLTLSVNGVVEIDIQAADAGVDSFPAGSLGFYNYSQTAVRYSLLSPRGRSICVIDPDDRCTGFDDSLDADADGVPDGCDVCADADDAVDADDDGAPDGCDLCADFDDAIDADGDDLPDGCDTCAMDPGNDEDGDGLCANLDNCPADDNADQDDLDEDGVGDACDSDRYGVQGGGCSATAQAGDMSGMLTLLALALLHGWRRRRKATAA
jgi:MYXO-CTERM domain-containing protein